MLTVSWNGQGTSQLRARFAIDAGTPTIRDLSVRRGGGEWAMLGQNLTPEYQVTTGVRRMSNDQANAFASLGSTSRPSCLKNINWYAFWDAPLSVPGYYPATCRWTGRRCRPGAGPERRRWDRAARFAEQVAALQSGSRGRPGYNPITKPARLHWRPRHPSAADEGRNPPRRLRVLGLVVRGQERRRAASR